MRSNVIERYKATLQLTKKQKMIVIGLMLGDGHLETQNQGKSYRLKVEQTEKRSWYINWLYTHFQKWVLTPPRVKTKKRNERITQSISFQTLSHPSFNFFAKEFYSVKTKKIPASIRTILSPLAMAVWFMDDGSLKSKHHRALILNTHCFTHDDLVLIQETFLKKYGLQAGIRKQREGSQLIFTEPSASRFAAIIWPELLPEFRYKLGKIGLTQLPKE